MKAILFFSMFLIAMAGCRLFNNPTQSDPDNNSEIDTVLLYAAYLFSGNADDTSGNNHHGIVYDAALCEDRFGNPGSAFAFDGIDDYISMDTLDFSTPITISLWINTASRNEVWNTIFGWNNHETKPAFEGIQIFTDGYGKLDIRMGTRAEDFKIRSTIVGDSLWHHVVVTKDTNNEVSVFIDNEHDTTLFVPVSFGNHHLLLIGKSHQPDDKREFFAGKVDDVFIYKKVLSSAEIASRYQN